MAPKSFRAKRSPERRPMWRQPVSASDAANSLLCASYGIRLSGLRKAVSLTPARANARRGATPSSESTSGRAATGPIRTSPGAEINNATRERSAALRRREVPAPELVPLWSIRANCLIPAKSWPVSNCSSQRDQSRTADASQVPTGESTAGPNLHNSRRPQLLAFTLASATREQGQRMNRAQATVFVVDAAQEVRIGLSYLLAGAGYQVRVFESAERFLEEPNAEMPG